MKNFYDEWLAVGDQIEDEFRSSPMVARDAELPWTATRQDAKVKVMMSADLGFPTMGGVVLKAEIPVGWHTGRHSHGEESLHIISGEGFSIVDGQRFDWKQGSTLQIPYRAEHQHFNTGDGPALYLSAMCFPLERFVKLARLQQFEDAGPHDSDALPGVAGQLSEHYSSGDRAIIHLEDAPLDPGDDENANLPANTNQHGLTRYLVVPRNGFRAKSVAIAHVFEEPPRFRGGRHKHLEAVLYVLEGEGRSEVGGTMQRWQAGDILHVPPAMWEHEHLNDTDQTYRLLRIQFGIRYWFTDLWRAGYRPQRIYDSSGRPIEARPLNAPGANQ